MQFDIDKAFDKMKQIYDIYVRFSETAHTEQALLTRPWCSMSTSSSFQERRQSFCPLPFNEIQNWDAGGTILKISSSSFMCICLFCCSRALYQPTGCMGQTLGKKEACLKGC